MLSRPLLTTFAALALGAVFGASTAPAASSLTPQQATTALAEGNQRYVGGAAAHPRQDATRRAEQAKGQTPFAVFLSCSDSRVPVETLFDQGVGDLFVVRVAGNVARADEIGSVEYGVDHLGAPLLVVLGHESCGAVKAVAENAAVHGHIPELVSPISEPVAAVRAQSPALAGPDLLHAAVEANAYHSLATLLRESHAVAARVRDGRLRAIAAIYDIETGSVRVLGPHPDQARLLDESAVETAPQAQTAGSAPASAEAANPASASAPVAHSPAASDAPPHFAAPEHGAGAHDAASLPWHIPATGAFLLAALLFAAHRYSIHGMAGWTVGRRLAAGFTLVILVLLGLATESVLSLHTALVDFTEYRQDARHAMLAGRIQANFLEMRLNVKDYQITRDGADTTRYADRKAKTLEFIREAKDELAHESERLARLEKIESQIAAHASGFGELAALPRNDKAAFASLGQKLAGIGTEIDHEVEALKLGLVADQNRDGPLLQAALRLTQAKVVWIALGAALLGAGLAIIIARSIVRPLRALGVELGAGADQTVSAAGQVSASSQSLAGGASEQAASMEESSASLEELNAMTKRNAESSASAKQTAASARASAADGETRILAMRSAMEDIQTSSREVTAIVKTIDEIAFQTNILALNAAVEAARAGEHGAGFAVVAEEVRALAQRSAQAARETSERIAASVEKSRHGAEISGHVSEHFTRIQADIVRLDALVAEIATASAEQSQGLGQLTQAVGQIDQVTQTNAGAAEECAAAAEELHGQGQMLLGAVNTLRRLTGGASGPAPAQAHASAAASPIPGPSTTPAHAARPEAARKPSSTFARRKPALVGPARPAPQAEAVAGDFFK